MIDLYVEPTYLRKEIDNLKQMIPLLAKGAMKKAYLDALSSGLYIVVSIKCITTYKSRYL